MKKLSVWDVLALFTAIATIILVIVFASIFTDPVSYLNPFPNPTTVATIFIPSGVAASSSNTPEAAAEGPTLSVPPTETGTIEPSLTTTITLIENPSASATETMTPTFTFTVTSTFAKTKTATLAGSTKTVTATKKVTPTGSVTPTRTATASIGATKTNTAIVQPTLTFTITSTKQPTLTFTPKPTTAPSTATSTTASGGCDGGDTSIESTVLSMVNYQRAQAGVPALSSSSALFTAARNHSQDMATNNFFSHTGSNSSSPFDRIASAGFSFSAAAENIYAGSGSNNSAGSAVGAWMNSEGHRTNMLNPIYTFAGVGYWCNPNSEYGGYFTLNLATP